MNESCKWIEVAGIIPALTGMRLPTKSKGDSYISSDGTTLGVNDANLAKRLIAKGNVHAKFQRGIIAWLDINMPRYMWSEIDTYKVGMCETSSESTMYTLVKECSNIDESMFSYSTPTTAVVDFKGTVDALAESFGERKLIPIDCLKACLPEGWMQRRIRGYSYQALRSMYFYRNNHRLHEWKIICKCIESLPHFEELILGCKKEDFKFDGEQ